MVVPDNLVKQFRALASKHVKTARSKRISVHVRPFFWRLWSELHRSSSADCNQYDTLHWWSVFLQYAHSAGLEFGMPSKQFRAGSLAPEAHGLWVSWFAGRSAYSKEQDYSSRKSIHLSKSWGLFYVLLLCAPQTARRRHSRDFCPGPITNLHRVSASHRPASRFIRNSGDSGDLRRIRGRKELVLLGSYLRTMWNSWSKSSASAWCVSCVFNCFHSFDIFKLIYFPTLFFIACHAGLYLRLSLSARPCHKMAGQSNKRQP